MYFTAKVGLESYSLSVQRIHPYFAQWAKRSHFSFQGYNTKHNTPIHNILSTAPQLSISQKALGTLPEDGNAMPKHVGATIHN
jgi:hypothetical protein